MAVLSTVVTISVVLFVFILSLLACCNQCFRPRRYQEKEGPLETNKNKQNVPMTVKLKLAAVGVDIAVKLIDAETYVI